MKIRHLFGGSVVALVALVALGCGSEVDEGARQQAAAFTQSAVDADPALKALQIAASNVDEYEISVKDIEVPVPSAAVGTSINGFGTRGLDWFQNPDVSYPDNKRWEQGSDTGKKCQWAAVFRFHAIFADPPAEAIRMRELPGGIWRGSFWSWTDDYASTDSVDHPTPSYAWASGLWKWIAASGANDTCRIPTRTMVVRMMTECYAHAQANDGDPKDCQMPGYDPAAEPARVIGDE